MRRIHCASFVPEIHVNIINLLFFVVAKHRKHGTSFGAVSPGKHHCEDSSRLSGRKNSKMVHLLWWYCQKKLLPSRSIVSKFDRQHAKRFSAISDLINFGTKREQNFLFLDRRSCCPHDKTDKVEDKSSMRIWGFSRTNEAHFSSLAA